MMVNSLSGLCPLLQPVSLFSLPNAPSLADVDWDESESGKSSSCHNHSTSTSISYLSSVGNEEMNGNVYLTSITLACQGRSVVPLRRILIPGAASSSWTLVVGMATCAWSTKTAPQVDAVSRRVSSVCGRLEHLTAFVSSRCGRSAE